jgi:hypothetical protein
MRRRLVPLSIAAALTLATLLLAQSANFDGRPAVVLSNQKLELTVLPLGATMAHLTLVDDAEKLSPFWNTERALNPAAPAPGRGSSLAHFLCLDGFGTPSEQERAAGWPTHGEAVRQPFETTMVATQPGTTTLKLQATLPLAQEAITRTITMLDGESVVYVNTQVENLLAVDRPVSWAEHATTGPPFLLPGQTVIDVSVSRCRVRDQKAGSTGKLPYGKDFVWPNAPLATGGTVDLTTIPTGEASLDLAACEVDPARVNGFITAMRPDKHLIFGYLFRREEYPWVMNWMNYTGNERAARGFEFSTQPFDISHRETVDAHDLFGIPTYKWLPGKSKLHSSFLIFYTKMPDNFGSISDVALANGKLRISDKAGHDITLEARRPL